MPPKIIKRCSTSFEDRKKCKFQEIIYVHQVRKKLNREVIPTLLKRFRKMVTFNNVTLEPAQNGNHIIMQPKHAQRREL